MKKLRIQLTVNDKEYDLVVEPNRTLAQMLREDLGLTGTKQGCEVGDCGSCTVIMNNETVNSCLVLAPQANHSEITTIEGVADGNELHPIQESMIEAGAIQCGFCTPGIILSAKSLLDNNPNPDADTIRHALSGNLCRCTGYQKIVEAVEDAAAKMGRD